MKRSLLFTLLLAACGSEPSEPGPVSNDQAAFAPAGAEPPAGNETASAGELKSAEVGPMSLQWDPASLARVDAQVGIPPNWDREVPGMKLIARERAELIGKAECMYGLSGQASPCTAEKEAGLAFALVETPYEELRAQITDPAPTPVTVGGREGIKWEIRAEGEGADYTLLPADAGTIVIVRHYRTSGNPDAAAVAQVFDSLSFGP